MTTVLGFSLSGVDSVWTSSRDPLRSSMLSERRGPYNVKEGSQYFPFQKSHVLTSENVIF